MYALYMEDLYKTLTEALAAWVTAVTDADVKAAEFRVPRSEGQLSVGTFVQGGAQEVADKLNAAPCPQVRAMAILARKGDAPCPESEDVRRALWAAYLAYRRGFWRAADERTVLTMTHALTGAERIALENRCGGAAAAIYKLKGEV